MVLTEEKICGCICASTQVSSVINKPAWIQSSACVLSVSFDVWLCIEISVVCVCLCIIWCLCIVISVLCVFLYHLFVCSVLCVCFCITCLSM